MQEAEAADKHKIKLPKLLTVATQKQVRQHKSKHVAEVFNDENSRTLYFKVRSHEQSFCATFRTPCSLRCQILVGL